MTPLSYLTARTEDPVTIGCLVWEVGSPAALLDECNANIKKKSKPVLKLKLVVEKMVAKKFQRARIALTFSSSSSSSSSAFSQSSATLLILFFLYSFSFVKWVKAGKEKRRKEALRYVDHKMKWGQENRLQANKEGVNLRSNDNITYPDSLSLTQQYHTG